MGKGMTPEGGRNLENWYNSPYWATKEKLDSKDVKLVVCYEVVNDSVKSEVLNEEESSDKEEGKEES
jgi:hypothetical protein|tara:strand:+ start:202 stop:402 length:201 start_codon:yes stop_codon:yes gene_type:complete